MHIAVFPLPSPRFARPDAPGGGPGVHPSRSIRAQFDLDSRFWPVHRVHPRSFSIKGAAVAPRRTVTARLTCADTLTVSARAWAHEVDAQGTQRFSIMEDDNEIAALLLRVASLPEKDPR